MSLNTAKVHTTLRRASVAHFNEVSQHFQPSFGMCTEPQAIEVSVMPATRACELCRACLACLSNHVVRACLCPWAQAQAFRFCLYGRSSLVESQSGRVTHEELH